MRASDSTAIRNAHSLPREMTLQMDAEQIMLEPSAAHGARELIVVFVGLQVFQWYKWPDEIRRNVVGLLVVYVDRARRPLIHNAERLILRATPRASAHARAHTSTRGEKNCSQQRVARVQVQLFQNGRNGPLHRSCVTMSQLYEGANEKKACVQYDDSRLPLCSLHHRRTRSAEDCDPREMTISKRCCFGACCWVANLRCTAHAPAHALDVAI